MLSRYRCWLSALQSSALLHWRSRWLESYYSEMSLMTCSHTMSTTFYAMIIFCRPAYEKGQHTTYEPLEVKYGRKAHDLTS